MLSKNIFYIIFSVFLLMLIMRISHSMMRPKRDHKVVLVPGYNNLFGRPFFRRGIRRFGLPWVGPRVGGYYVGPFGRRYRNVAKRAMRRAKRHGSMTPI